MCDSLLQTGRDGRDWCVVEDSMEGGSLGEQLEPFQPGAGGSGRMEWGDHGTRRARQWVSQNSRNGGVGLAQAHWKARGGARAGHGLQRERERERESSSSALPGPAEEVFGSSDEEGMEGEWEEEEGRVGRPGRLWAPLSQGEGSLEQPGQRGPYWDLSFDKRLQARVYRFQMCCKRLREVMGSADAARSRGVLDTIERVQNESAQMAMFMEGRAAFLAKARVGRSGSGDGEGVEKEGDGGGGGGGEKSASLVQMRVAEMEHEEKVLRKLLSEKDRAIAFATSEMRKMQAERHKLEAEMKKVQCEKDRATALANIEMRKVQAERDRVEGEVRKLQAEKERVEEEAGVRVKELEAERDKMEAEAEASAKKWEAEKKIMVSDAMAALKVVQAKAQVEIEHAVRVKNELRAKLEVEVAARGQELACKICFSAPRNVVLLPCFHGHYCSLCIDTHRRKSSTCPVCRTYISGTVPYTA